MVLHLVALLRSYLQHGLDSQLPRRRLMVGANVGGAPMLLTHVLMVVEGEVSLCKRNLVKGAPQIEYVRCGRGTILGELEMIKHYSRLHR